MFICERCGHCCRHLGLNELYRDLDRGDGVCKYLHGNLCGIYEERPLLCRVDECYLRFFSNVMDRETYDALTSRICYSLQQLATKEKE